MSPKLKTLTLMLAAVSGLALITTTSADAKTKTGIVADRHMSTRIIKINAGKKVKAKMYTSKARTKSIGYVRKINGALGKSSYEIAVRSKNGKMTYYSRVRSLNKKTGKYKAVYINDKYLLVGSKKSNTATKPSKTKNNKKTKSDKATANRFTSTKAIGYHRGFTDNDDDLTYDPDMENITPIKNYNLSLYRDEVLFQLNHYRALHGVAPLSIDDGLNQIAQTRAETELKLELNGEDTGHYEADGQTSKFVAVANKLGLPVPHAECLGADTVAIKSLDNDANTANEIDLANLNVFNYTVADAPANYGHRDLIKKAKYTKVGIGMAVDPKTGAESDALNFY